MRLAAVALTLPLIAAWGLSACIVPIPEHYNIGRAATVDPLTIKVGETTKEDVLQRLGDPDVIWTDERVFAYVWTNVKGGVLVVMPAAPFIAGGDFGSQELLLIQFDDAGLVQRVDRTRRPRHVDLGEFLKTWIKGAENAHT